MKVYVPVCLFVISAVAALSNTDLNSLEDDQDVLYWKHEGWIRGARVESHKSIELTFALKQENVDVLEDILTKVSDPSSQLYGQYMTINDITELVSPSRKSIKVVQDWLKRRGVAQCNLNANRDFLVCWMSCKVAEKLLPGSALYYFSHNKLSKKVIRSVSRYYVPADVADHLDFVGGLHRFPAVNFFKTQKERNTIPDNQPEGVHIGVYPKVLRQRYNLTEEDVGSHPNNSQVVAQFLEQYFSQSDFSEFMSIFVGSEFVHRNQIDKVIGPNSGRSGVEASLDTQYIAGLGANITTWFWSTGGRHENQEPFLEWIIAVGNTSTVPWVHSVSYGDNEDSLSTVYMQRINTEFMKAGVRGISILFASGDDGAGCKKNKFRPSFPASSPYVTTVGGTGFNNPFGTGKEFAYEISGGGFSNVFAQPNYQAEQVAHFLSSEGVPSSQYFNKTGRAYPDVAALSRHFWIVNNRIPAPGIAGTSAATPTVAGIMSMVNEHRLHNNKPTLGFLNPFLYKNPQALFDVTSGCNEGCLSGDKGFCATDGYDPVSGNGTPNYPELVKAAMMI